MERYLIGNLYYEIADGHSKKDGYAQAQNSYVKTKEYFTKKLQQKAKKLPNTLKKPINLNQVLQKLQKNNNLAKSAEANFGLSGQRAADGIRRAQERLSHLERVISSEAEMKAKNIKENPSGEDYQKIAKEVKDSVNELKEKQRRGEKGKTKYYGVSIDADWEELISVAISKKQYYSTFESVIKGKLKIANEFANTLNQAREIISNIQEDLKAMAEAANQLLTSDSVKNTTHLQNFIKDIDSGMSVDKILEKIHHGKIGNTDFGSAWGYIMENVSAAAVDAVIASIPKETLEATIAKQIQSAKASTWAGTAERTVIRGLTSEGKEPLTDMTVTITFNDGSSQTHRASIKNYNFNAKRQNKNSKSHSVLRSNFFAIGNYELKGIKPKDRLYFLRVLAATKKENVDPSTPNYIGAKYASQIFFGEDMKRDENHSDLTDLIIVNGVMMSSRYYYDKIKPIASYDTGAVLSPGQWIAKENVESFIKQVTQGEFKFEASFSPDAFGGMSSAIMGTESTI